MQERGILNIPNVPNFGPQRLPRWLAPLLQLFGKRKQDIEGRYPPQEKYRSEQINCDRGEAQGHKKDLKSLFKREWCSRAANKPSLLFPSHLLCYAWYCSSEVHTQRGGTRRLRCQGNEGLSPSNLLVIEYIKMNTNSPFLGFLSVLRRKKKNKKTTAAMQDYFFCFSFT